MLEREGKLKSLLLAGVLVVSLSVELAAQQTIVLKVNAGVREGSFNAAWNYFGYDEPNYTYTKYGKRLLGELSGLSPLPVHIRAHNLLTTGDGTPALKWGSTNAYTEDAEGRPIYNWEILDKIFDAYREAGIHPFVEIGFMPKALSIHPDPYQHDWPRGPLWTGWAYPPKDYAKWAELVRQWVLHSAERYGRREVAGWRWEVWNEPDIGYWQGTPEEYFKLYDYTADAVKRALPEAHVGGPATTGPAAPKAARFLQNFLAHCESGRNFATGKTGAPLDFISFHAKGTTRMTDGHVEMNVRRNLEDIAKGFEIVRDFPKLAGLPVYVTESDPEGCAACSAQSHPQNGYRNTSQYASYEALMQTSALKLAAEYKINLQGVLTWAFEYDDQPCYAGFRTLMTCGFDEPVLNFFRMMGLISGERIQSKSSGALPLAEVLKSGARSSPDIDAIATRENDTVNILEWNYDDDAAPAPSAAVELTLAGIPSAARRVLVEHYRIDESTSNSYSAWLAMGSPPQPSPAQLAKLEAAGQLQMLASPEWVNASQGKVVLIFDLPRQAVSLLRLTW